MEESSVFLMCLLANSLRLLK